MEATDKATDILINDRSEYDPIAEYIHYHDGYTRLEALLDYCREFHPALLDDDSIDWGDIVSYFTPKKAEDF